MTMLDRLREFAKQEEPKDPNILVCPFIAIERGELRALIEVAEAAKECFIDNAGQDEVGRLMEAIDALEVTV